MTRRTNQWVASMVTAGMLAMVAIGPGPGCARNRAAAIADPMAEVRNERLGEPRRREAVRRVWAQVERGEIDRIAVREDLKTIAWSSAWPVGLRLEALGAVTSDTTEAGRADTRHMVRLMIPREPEPDITAFLSDLSAVEGWTETTPALVRSLARPRWAVPDDQRPEYRALAALNPDRTVEAVAFEVFLSPPPADARGIVTPERVRADAWDLLARLDRDGSQRAELILAETSSAQGPLADMRLMLRELGTLPLTGEEIRWLTALRDQSDPARRAWWAATRGVVRGLDVQRTGRLQMRHLEPIRWAAAHRPEWVGMTREELLSTLAQRLEGRQFHRRRPDRAEVRPGPDRLADVGDHLSWGDLIGILVIDEALAQRSVVTAFFEQAHQDRKDRSAEYGGLLRARPPQNAASRGTPAIGGLGGPEFAAVLYPPRAANRRGDHEFVAPTDMINQSYHALAHYHFHVQDLRNSQYAGPSPADLVYAARFGRACLVLTSVGTSALNADYYQPDGVVLDLGTLTE